MTLRIPEPPSAVAWPPGTEGLSCLSPFPQGSPSCAPGPVSKDYCFLYFVCYSGCLRWDSTSGLIIPSWLSEHSQIIFKTNHIFKNTFGWVCIYCKKLLPNQGSLLKAQQVNPETPRSAAEKGFLCKAAKQGDERTNLKSASWKARGFYGIKLRESGERWSETRERWGSRHSVQVQLGFFTGRVLRKW